METIDVVIPGSDGLVVICGRDAPNPARFADLAFQVAGFIFDDEAKRVTSLRWIPAHVPPYTEISASAGGDVIYCTPPARSLSFIVPRITCAISVLLLLSGEKQQQYDLGDYTLVDACSLHPQNRTPALLFHRVQPRFKDTTETATETERETHHVVSTVPALLGDGSMDHRCQQLFLLWGIDASYDGVVFSLANDNCPEMRTFRPMAMLFDVIFDAVFAWCGTSNRFGHNVLCIVEQVCPKPTQFVQIRSVARTLRFPILLGHGCPDDNVVSVEEMCLTWIVFRPGDGAAQYVHFQWDPILIRMVIVPREQVDAGMTTDG
jgi:hypothetical protein